MSGFDVQDILDAVGVTNKKIADNSDLVQGLMRQQVQAGADESTAVQSSADNAAIVMRAKGLAQQEAERKTYEAVTTMGANPEAASSIMDKVGTEWRQASLDANQRLSDLDKKMQVRFLDHPIDYITNKITFEDDVKSAEMAEKRRDSAANTLREAQANTQSAQFVHNALAQTVTTATLDASVAGLQAEADQKRAVLRQKLAGAQIGDLQILSNMDIQQLNNLSTGFDAKAKQEHLNMAGQQLVLAQKADARSEKQYNLQLERYNKTLSDEKAEATDLHGIAETVRTGAASMGITNVTAMNDGKIIQMLKMKGDGFDDYLKAGMKSQATGRPIASETSGDAARMVITNGAPLRPEQGSVRKLLTESFTSAADPKNATLGGYNPTKKDEVVGATTKVIATKVAGMKDNIAIGDNTNIYAPPPLTSVAEIPSIKSSKFYRAILDTSLKAGGLNEFNSDQLGSMAVAAIKKGDISFNEAVTGFQAMHAGAARLNNATKNFEGFGLPNQSSFKVTIPNALGIPKSYDLSTAQDANRFMMEKMAAEKIPGTTKALASPFMGIYN